MKTKQIAEILGKSRQFLENVVNGRGNFGYQAAKKATLLIGGTLDVWMDKSYTEERKKLFRTLRGR